MPARVVMLSPYRMPAHHALMLGDAHTNIWLNAFRLSWHPGLLQLINHLPTIADPADHAEPQANTLYILPEAPPPYLPENWREMVRQCNAVVVDATIEWAESVARLQEAVPHLPMTSRQCDVTCAIGFGYAVIETLFEAMDHVRTLDTTAFFNEAKAAATDDADAAKAAAQRLLAARETLYPAPIHLLDLSILGQGERPDCERGAAPLNIIATAQSLADLPVERLASIRAGVGSGAVEVCGGLDCDRVEAILPIESQLWNLRRGQERMRELLGQPVKAFARAGAAFHPYLPNWLAHGDMSKLVYISLDGGAMPHHAAASIRWPAPDGRQVDAFTRAPLPASDPQSGFHLALHLHQTIMQDSSAVLHLRHGTPMAGLWYQDLLTLSALAPVLGTWTSVSRFLDDATVGEYASATSMDDYSPEVPTVADPVSSFGRLIRVRRRIDAARTYLALMQSLGTPADIALLQHIDECENQCERTMGAEPPDWRKVETGAATKLAERLVARSTSGQPGQLVLNPSPFARRVGLEIMGLGVRPPTDGPVKAVQHDGEVTRLVVEVPGLGYSWIPNGDAESSPPRMTLASGTTVRNEFFEAEIDPATGGLQVFRGVHGRANLLGQQLIWQPGSTMRATDVGITANGPALGEVTATGELLDEHSQRLARFTQRFRAWLGRPLLELHITLHPDKPPVGHAWHAYYGSRFAARDENVKLIRGVFGHPSVTTGNRPGSPDYLEMQVGKQSVQLLTGGLPFAERHGQRMVDILLVTQGETNSNFDLCLGLNRPQAAQSAQGMVSPVAVVPINNGPPPTGPTGWLAHLDTSNVLLTSLRPAKEPNAFMARLFEHTGTGGPVNLRFARNPREAAIVDANGLIVMDALVDGDTASFDVMAHDLVNVRVTW